jgi:cytochrome c-type biogenesis protein CcmH/NrfF
MRLRRTAIFVLAAWVSLSAVVVPALAAAACPRTSEVALENKIMCQVCGVPLAVANSLEADRERALITQLVNRCESASQIEAAMVAEYGAGILATPATHGFAITAWLVPAIGIAVAALLIAGVLMSTRQPPPRRMRVSTPCSPPTPSGARPLLIGERAMQPVGCDPGQLRDDRRGWARLGAGVDQPTKRVERGPDVVLGRRGATDHKRDLTVGRVGRVARRQPGGAPRTISSRSLVPSWAVERRSPSSRSAAIA